jgi:N-acetylglucosaminyldiphosphoundecaprenol N-acetyl-beta-D-mannosaminyltransferase
VSSYAYSPRDGRAPIGPSRAARAFRFGPLEVAPLAPADVVDWIVGRAQAHEPSIVVTSNINHLRLARRDEGFRDVVRRSELNVADGWPLVLASRLLGSAVPARVAGIDLVDAVLHSPHRLRVAILGGPPGAAEALARRAASAHDVCLVDPLRKGAWEADRAVDSLRSSLAAARPNLVLIGLGPPRQELLADKVRPVVCGPIICCGASIEVLAGLTPRAPLLLQRVGLEWAFRLALEPRRLFKRYLLAGGCFLRVLGTEILKSP